MLEARNARALTKVKADLRGPPGRQKEKVERRLRPILLARLKPQVALTLFTRPEIGNNLAAPQLQVPGTDRLLLLQLETNGAE